MGFALGARRLARYGTLLVGIELALSLYNLAGVGIGVAVMLGCGGASDTKEDANIRASIAGAYHPDGHALTVGGDDSGGGDLTAGDVIRLRFLPVSEMGAMAVAYGGYAPELMWGEFAKNEAEFQLEVQSYSLQWKGLDDNVSMHSASGTASFTDRGASIEDETGWLTGNYKRGGGIAPTHHHPMLSWAGSHEMDTEEFGGHAATPVLSSLHVSSDGVLTGSESPTNCVLSGYTKVKAPSLEIYDASFELSGCEAIDGYHGKERNGQYRAVLMRMDSGQIVLIGHNETVGHVFVARD